MKRVSTLSIILTVIPTIMVGTHAVGRVQDATSSVQTQTTPTQVEVPPVTEGTASSSAQIEATAVKDVDASPYPRFIEKPEVQGVVRCVGSSSIGLFLNAVKPVLASDQPEIEIVVTSSGSGEGPKALASREADLAPMSRAMRADEIAMVEKARGAKVEWIDIAVDAIAVCVNRANPMTRISLRDLDRIFGRERRRGGGPAVIWGDVGIRDAAWSAKKITLYGMGPKSGSHGIVQDIVLQGGSFRTTVNEEPVASSVVQAIATDPTAIGYCSAYFDAVRIRQLEIELEDGTFVAPTEAAIRSGRYPLTRSMRIYFVNDRNERSDAAMQVLRFLVSEDGQDVIRNLGQKTLSPEQAHTHFAKLK
jgi:phosphate transport system substrate-binding protein